MNALAPIQSLFTTSRGQFHVYKYRIAGTSKYVPNWPLFFFRNILCFPIKDGKGRIFRRIYACRALTYFLSNCISYMRLFRFTSEFLVNLVVVVFVLFIYEYQNFTILLFIFLFFTKNLEVIGVGQLVNKLNGKSKC